MNATTNAFGCEAYTGSTSVDQVFQTSCIEGLHLLSVFVHCFRKRTNHACFGVFIQKRREINQLIWFSYIVVMLNHHVSAIGTSEATV